MDALVAEVGLRGLILRAGVDQPVGEGGATLNALQRRKLGLARALMKKPNAMLLDQIAQTDGPADQSLRALLHRELRGGALIWTAAREDQAPDADHLLVIDDAGRVSQRQVRDGAADPGSGAVDGG